MASSIASSATWDGVKIGGIGRSTRRPAPRRGRVAGKTGARNGRRGRGNEGAVAGWRLAGRLAGDVVMVALWAGMIPGLMWLGVAAGF